MLRRLLTDRRTIPFVLCFQIVPLVMLPPSSYRLESQEWWLPLLLVLLVLFALFQILVRRTPAANPWYLMGFSQGFNIISRLMLLLPHAGISKGDVRELNTAYILLTLGAIVLSWLEIMYCELPEVRSVVQARPVARQTS